MWRCLNDVFGYCSGEPEFEGDGTEIKSGTLETTVKTCVLNPKTCGKHQLPSETDNPEKLAQLSGDSYKETITYTDKPEDKKGKKKTESKPVQSERLL